MPLLLIDYEIAFCKAFCEASFLPFFSQISLCVWHDQVAVWPDTVVLWKQFLQLPFSQLVTIYTVILLQKLQIYN